MVLRDAREFDSRKPCVALDRFASPGRARGGSAVMRSLLLLLVLPPACSTPEPADPSRAWSRALECCRDGDSEGAVAALRVALGTGSASVQSALLEPAFARNGLRDRPDFRDAIHEGAQVQRVTRLTLAPDDEPGEWIEIEGRTVDAAGRPVPGAVVRLFVTDAEGRYHPTIPGERVPRLFGTLVTDEQGHFGFRTVRPGPYPGTRNARHVHVAASRGALRLAVPHYAVFDDDPLLAEPQNAEQRGEAVRIRMRVEGGRAMGALDLPLR